MSELVINYVEAFAIDLLSAKFFKINQKLIKIN